MKAWLLKAQTGLSALEIAEVPDPAPQAREAILEVHYAGLNPADRYLAERQYPARPQLPHILGRDGMGTVVRVGPEVDRVRPGDRRVILRGDTGGNRPGTFAQFVAVPEDQLVEVPSGWSEPEAAGAALVYLTAYQALTMWSDLPERAVVLVTGASGGVGVASVQLAAAMGHQVLALSRSEEKARRLTALGAALTFDPSDPQWRDKARQSLKPRRVDLAIDNIGGTLLPQVIDALGDLGRVSLVGRLAGPVPEFNTATLFFRRIRMGGVAVGAYTAEESRAAWEALVGLLQKSGQRPLVDSVHPFDQLVKAFERLAAGPMGKVLLQVK